MVGTHDFRSFCGLKRFKKSTVRTITDISITQDGAEVRLEFTGNGFLMRMVRILAGTLVEVGLGQREADSMPAVLARPRPCCRWACAACARSCVGACGILIYMKRRFPEGNRLLFCLEGQ